MSKLSLVWEVAKRMPKARISRANIAVTFRCNHRCVMCNIWKNNKDRKGRGELTSREVSQIIRHNNLLWVSFTGGEPFLNKDIKWILASALLHCGLVSIVSNGSYPEWIEECIKRSLVTSSALLVFSLSLEGDEQKHDVITGVEGSYKQVIDTIERLKRINNDRFYLGIEHLLSPHTDGEQEHVERIAKEYKIGLTYAREQKAPYYHNVNGAQPETIASPSYKMSINSFDMMHNLFVFGLKRGNRKLCEAGSYSVFIDPYANLYPCLPQAPDNPIKNLRETDYVIGDISKEADEVFKKCQSPCYTPCEVYASMLFRPWRLL